MAGESGTGRGGMVPCSVGITITEQFAYRSIEYRIHMIRIHKIIVVTGVAIISDFEQINCQKWIFHGGAGY